MESKKAATFTVEFAAPELGTFSHELALRVNNNPFEQYKVALTGDHESWTQVLHSHSSVVSATATQCYAASCHVPVAIFCLSDLGVDKLSNSITVMLLFGLCCPQVNVLRRRSCSWACLPEASPCRMCTWRHLLSMLVASGRHPPWASTRSQQARQQHLQAQHCQQQLACQFPRSRQAAVAARLLSLWQTTAATSTSGTSGLSIHS